MINNKKKNSLDVIFLKKNFDKNFLDLVKKYFYHESLDHLKKDWGANQYLKNKNKKQIRKAINIFGKNPHIRNFEKNLPKIQKKRISKIRKILKNKFSQIKPLLSNHIKNRCKDLNKPEFEIYGNITEANSNLELKVHTDPPPYIISCIISVTNFKTAKTTFFKPSKINKELYRKNFQNFNNFKVAKSFNQEPGDFLIWKVNSNSWHGVKRNLSDKRLSINLHYKFSEKYLKKFYKKNETLYPIINKNNLVKNYFL